MLYGLGLKLQQVHNSLNHFVLELSQKLLKADVARQVLIEHQQNLHKEEAD